MLRYHPEGARALLRKCGFPDGIDSEKNRVSVDLIFEGAPAVSEILQRQWRTNLNIDVKLQKREFVVWIRTLLDVNYPGVILGGWTGKYPDPATFLDMFHSGSLQSGTGWSDPKFDSLLAAADAAPSLGARMQRLAECERFLLAAMPLIPIHFHVYSSLVGPYVRGWASNPLNEHHFKYVWIDQNWRPS